MHPLRIAALGSSFAAGPGLAPVLDQNARRSGSNYPHLLAKFLSADLTDLTVSGATLLNILSQPQIVSGISFPPQVSLIPSDTDIVTITGGGNDLGYIGALTSDAMTGVRGIGWILGMVLNRVMGPISEMPSLDECVDRFCKVIDAVHLKAPKARIFLVEYLTVLGGDAVPNVNTQLNHAQIEKGRAAAKLVKRCYAEAAKLREGICELVEIAEMSWDHGIGSTEEWVTGLSLLGLVRGSAPFHPTSRGMEVVAERIEAAIVRRGPGT